MYLYTIYTTLQHTVKLEPILNKDLLLIFISSKALCNTNVFAWSEYLEGKEVFFNHFYGSKIYTFV